MAYKDISKQRAATRDHYRRNSAIYKDRAKAHSKRVAQGVRAYIAQHLRSHPCISCGLADPIVLEFDHRDPKLKSFNIGDAIRRKLALKRVIAEIRKCDVRCANCHRRRTYEQRRIASQDDTIVDLLDPLPLFDSV